MIHESLSSKHRSSGSSTRPLPVFQNVLSTEFFLVCIFPYLNWLGKSPYSVQIRQNIDQKKLFVLILFLYSTFSIIYNFKSTFFPQVLSHKKDKPSLDENYSILKQGNDIKALSNGKTFKYMVDAAERKHFGGIWEAPSEYS